MSKKKYYQLFLFAAFLLFCLLILYKSMGYLFFRESMKKPIPEGIPVRDIVFLPVNDPDNKNLGTLGFINADGSGRVEYHFAVIGGSLDMLGLRRYTYEIGNPIWAKSDYSVYFNIGDSGPNLRAIASDGRLIGQDCYLVTEGGGVGKADDVFGHVDEDAPIWEAYKNQVKKSKSLWIRINLDTCKISGTITLPIDETEYYFMYIVGETDDGTLVIDALRSDGISRVLVVNPEAESLDSWDGHLSALSKDGKFVAFYGSDNYLTIRSLETQKDRKLIVNADNPHFWSASSWSPDGKWLVYNTEDGKIFKVNIDTLEKIYLTDGWSPDWK